MNRRTPFPLWPLAFCFFQAACANETARVSSIPRDSAGIVIVENDTDHNDVQCHVSAEPRLVIGEADGAPGYSFYRMFDGTILEDGRIAVVNQGSSEIRVYDASGTFLHAFGRAGGGPGEFQSVFQLLPGPGDTLIVGDYSPWRYSYFTADGTYVRAVVPQPVDLNSPRSHGVLADGTFIIAQTCCLTREPEFRERSLHVVRADAEGAHVDSLHVYPHGLLGRLGRPQLRLMGFPIFESFSDVAIGHDRWVGGYGAKPEIEVRAPDGRLLTLIRWHDNDRTVTPDEVDEYRRAHVAVSTSPAERELLEAEVSDERPVADFFPAFTSIEIARSGEIWVRLFDRPLQPRPPQWLVFQADGRFLCHATTPAGFGRFGLWEIGTDYLLGNGRDALDVERVLVYNWSRPG